MNRFQFSRLLAIFLLGCLAYPLRAAEPASFTGGWSTVDPNAIDFSLDLTQTGDHLEGYHASIMPKGRRIDAVLSSEGKPSITGTVSGGIAHVTFHSGYGDGTGEATLTRKGNRLIWKIVQSTGQHYLPDNSTLQRSKPEEKK